MRLIYFGTGSFALPALEGLKEHLCLVVTQPDRPSGRGMRLQPSAVKLAALERGIPVESPEKTRAPEFVQFLREQQADALVVASYGQILSQAVLDSAARGGINLHGSILPKYRGAAPIQRCIWEGEVETGITLMQMDKGMDTGDMIEIVKTSIGPDETYSELQDRLALVAADLAVQWLPRIVEGNYPRTPQDSTMATTAPKMEKSDGELKLDEPANLEYNRFRAFTSNPGAFLITKLGLLRIHRARLSSLSGPAGEVLPNKAELTVGFGQGALEFLEVQLEGKKRMAGRDFANGARLRSGDSLRI